MPTTYPKASSSEVTGLLVLLHGHGDSEDVARLADDLDLEIDEIFPSLEFAEALGLVTVTDGRVTMTPVGAKLVAGSIRERKTILREQLKRTTLFRTLLSALESSPEHRLTEEELVRLIDFTPAPADLLVQNIINWGRGAGLFRFDAEQRVLLPWRTRGGKQTAAESRPPPPPPATTESASTPDDGGLDAGPDAKSALLPLGA